MRTRLACAAVVAFVAAAGAARADAPSEADALFTQGRELLERGQYAEACPKLQRSEDLSPAVGTLLNLGYCWEQLARWRSAMDAYGAAHVLATKAGDAKRAAFAKEHLAAVESKATKVVVRVVPPAAPGMEVKRNGVVVPPAEWDKPTAVDPDEIEVSASAPGRAPWKSVVMARGDGSVVTVYVPPLAGVPAPKAPATNGGLGGRRVGAIFLWGASAEALAAGATAALGAKARYDDSLAGCDARGCDPSALDAQHGAVVEGNIATALVGLGIAFVAAGTYLWLVGNAGESGRTRAALRSLAGGASF